MLGFSRSYVLFSPRSFASDALGTVLEIVLNPTTPDMVSHPGSLKASGASPGFHGKFEVWQGLRRRAAQTVMGFPS